MGRANVLARAFLGSGALAADEGSDVDEVRKASNAADREASDEAAEGCAGWEASPPPAPDEYGRAAGGGGCCGSVIGAGGAADGVWPGCCQ